MSETITPEDLRRRWEAVQASAKEQLGELAASLWLSVGLHGAPPTTIELLRSLGADVERLPGSRGRGSYYTRAMLDCEEDGLDAGLSAFTDHKRPDADAEEHF